MPKDQTDELLKPLDSDGQPQIEDDEEIVDLLEVIKPGKSVKKETPTAGDDADFGADLDAMLEKLESEEQLTDGKSAAPFPDPTPVDHTVDPHETLDMPSMDDLNNLLETLGAIKDPEGATQHAGQNSQSEPVLSADQDAAPIMEQLTSPAPVVESVARSVASEGGDEDHVPMDLDDLPIAVNSAAAPAAAPAGNGQPDLDALLAEAAPQAAAQPAAPAAAPAGNGQPDLDALLAEAAPQAAAQPAAPAAAPAGNGQPDLDALLAEAAPQAAAQPAAPAAAPAGNGQPDLDALLAEAAPQAAAQPAAPAAAPAGNGQPGLDALLAEAAPQAAAQPAAPAAAPAGNGQPDLDALLAEAAPQAAAQPAAPAAAPAGNGQPDLDALLAEADPQAATQPAAPAAAPAGDGQPDLDALLAEGEPQVAALQTDDGSERDLPAVVEETLPEVAVQSLQKEEQPVPMVADEAEPITEQAIHGEDEQLPNVTSRPSTPPRYDEVDLNELDALLDDMLATAPAPGPVSSSTSGGGAAPMASSASFETGSGVDLTFLQQAVIRMDNAIQELREELKEKESVIASQQEAITVLQSRLENMANGLDKMAAEAAAQVIREELAALLQES